MKTNVSDSKRLSARLSIRIAFFITIIFVVLSFIRTPFLLLSELDKVVTYRYQWQNMKVETGPDILGVPDRVMPQKIKDRHFQLLAGDVYCIVTYNRDTQMLSEYNSKAKLHLPVNQSHMSCGDVPMTRTPPFFHVLTNMTVEGYRFLLGHGLFQINKNIHFVKDHDLYFTYVSKSVDVLGFRGEIRTYVNIEYAYFLRIKTILFQLVTAVFMIYITAFLAAYFAAKDIFKPLHTALKKLIHVNKNNFRERIPYHSKNNSYLNQLTDEVNFILERAEQAVLSQQQSAREITHQIRTPLQSIMHSVDYFRMFGFKNEKKVEERLNIIASQVERISSMTEKIITLSKLQEIETENGHSYSLSRHMIDYLDRKMMDDEKITNEMSIKEGIFTTIPFNHILHILDSLMENAVKYSFEPKWIYTGLASDGASIQITIKNRGVEIPEDELCLIFEHSYRGKAVQKDSAGTGLGLAVVKRFVELHKGRTDVTSKDNITTFVVTLPNK
ncbi:HAMP domain-containing sensor histidine kinase [Paenibacillus sp. BSR1-1]|uniref:sensor histidine kinase n=1 Tax=Paenibacillus sp. BSR1-1 TaxID=3020845 RepID=UPI0025B25799|nr:HAMP domain-containing sensor histidine kinase [Paenibacillus sp. BSR1-1]MDN3019169.1 HAMP domain-containing sensor histidine kinase [Paenibacillus sp. BSR1-1]